MLPRLSGCTKHPEAGRNKKYECLQCRRLAHKDWKARNPDKVKDQKARWHRKTRKCATPLTKAAPAAILRRLQISSERASTLNRLPSWIKEDEMYEIYKDCVELEVLTGIKMHVDHVVPISGKAVSGLHVPWNLQILTASDNCRKGNKF